MELAAAREAMLSGSGREAELERQHQLMLEQEREKRIQHIQQIGIKRMMQAGLARGARLRLGIMGLDSFP